MREVFAWATVPFASAAEGAMAITGLYRLFAWVAIGCLAGFHAAYKGYPKIASILLCSPFGPLSLLVVFFLPPVAEGRERVAADQQVEEEQVESQETFICRNCGRENSVTTRVCPRCEQRFK